MIIQSGWLKMSIVSPLKRMWPFIEQTCNLFTQGCFVPRLVGSGEEDFLMWSLYFHYHLPLKKDDLCQGWIKLAQWF